MKDNGFFPEVNGNFGFGCMRLPMNGDKVNLEEFSKMTDMFIGAGFNYFDTAHGYIGGQSETAIRECVSKRYCRDKFLLADKLTAPYFNGKDDIRPFFESQLSACGVDRFDFYLMHAQDRNSYKKFRQTGAYEVAARMRDEGLIGRLGISFHDKADVLDGILSEQPEIEFVQIQLNYADFDDASVESRKVYEVCEKHKKPVLVMEPVKGGSLVNLPKEADDVLRGLRGGSNASYAIRFAASFPSVSVVLSGMSDTDQMSDNVSFMKDFRPLDEKELEAVGRVLSIFRKLDIIPCTACRYCVEENTCPKGIRIPDMFSALNAYSAFRNWNTKFYYNAVLTGEDHGKASECLGCGGCEEVCPQHLPIRRLLSDVADAFEKKKEKK